MYTASNFQYLLNYGFIPEYNHHNCIEFNILFDEELVNYTGLHSNYFLFIK